MMLITKTEFWKQIDLVSPRIEMGNRGEVKLAIREKSPRNLVAPYPCGLLKASTNNEPKDYQVKRECCHFRVSLADHKRGMHSIYFRAVLRTRVPRNVIRRRLVLDIGKRCRVLADAGITA
jgi:hypothetical protein